MNASSPTPDIVTHRLDNGMVLLVQPMPGVRSAALTFSVPAGLTSEPADRSGIGSIVSEMLMRGAGDRDSRQLADAFDATGCTRSIDVGSRSMIFSGTMIGDRLGEALPLFADTICRPRLEHATFEPSQSLALQALQSLADDPRERASIEARRRHFPAPFNRATLGSQSGIESATLDDVCAWWEVQAVPGGTLLGVAGAVDPDRVADEVARAFEGWRGEAREPAPSAAPIRGAGHEADDSSQVQVIAMFEVANEADESASIREKLAGSVLSGGMSGRLFTEVREKRGLCYAVSAGYRGDELFGILSAYVGTTPERAQESLDVLTAELHRIRTADGAVTREEFERARTGMRASIVFHGESTASRSMALVGDFRKLGRVRTLDEMTGAIDAVTLESLNEHLQSRPLGGATLQTLGSVELTPPEGF